MQVDNPTELYKVYYKRYYQGCRAIVKITLLWLQRIQNNMP